MHKLPAIAVALTLWAPWSVQASFNGPIRLGFGPLFIIGAAFALPGAVLVMVIERLGATRQPPAWLGGVTALAGVYCTARAVGWIGPGGDRTFFLLPIPVLLEITLSAWVRTPPLRQATGWSIAMASVILLWAGHMTSGASTTLEKLGLILGGVSVTSLLWYLGFCAGQKAVLRSREFTPGMGPMDRGGTETGA